VTLGKTCSILGAFEKKSRSARGRNRSISSCRAGFVERALCKRVGGKGEVGAWRVLREHWFLLFFGGNRQRTENHRTGFNGVMKRFAVRRGAGEIFMENRNGGRKSKRHYPT